MNPVHEQEKENAVGFGVYDVAIIDKLRSVFKDNTISILPVEDAFRFVSQLNADKLDLPTISTTRLGITILSSQVNQAAKTIGHYVGRDGENNNVYVQSIPIRIEYQMDIFTVDRASNDAIVRELIFFFMLKPTLVAHYRYGLNIDHNFNLFLNEDVTDNSDTLEHVNSGVKFRTTLTFYTDDARLVRRKRQRQGDIAAVVKTTRKKYIPKN
jgi:hypothetical protein